MTTQNSPLDTSALPCDTECMETTMYVVIFNAGDVRDAHGPFVNLAAAQTWATVNGGTVMPLRPATAIPNRVRIALTQVRVAV